MRTLVVLLAAAGASLMAVGTASAEMLERTGLFGGLTLTYKVLLPPGYDGKQAYPAVLVFTGGPQSLEMAERTLSVDWRQEAERRRYIVISPGTPDGALFFQRADRVFPSFLDQILRDYRVRGGKLHVAGHSNGGLSAFHVAALYPQYFATLTGYPGLLDAGDISRAAALKPLCIFMHVGEMDEGWRRAMQEQSDNLARQGYRIRFTVEKNQIHRLNAPTINLSPRLFDQIESCQQ
jgi:poly(3-hydroxybutyrate) depolymerase